MKIWKIAQASSLMYYVDTESRGILLTPDPSFANHESDQVAVFILRHGEYYNPHKTFMNITDDDANKLKNMGFLGVILGDYILIFEIEAMKRVGKYDFNQKIVIW